MGLWLQNNEITTLFFGGVNADQCVVSTLIILSSLRQT
jgi:nicotinamidase-related amidase